MSEFTLLKLQFENASFTANAPFSGADEGSDEADSETAADESDESDQTDEGGNGRLLALVVGLGFLVAVAVVVRKLRGEEE